jgi:ATP-dependent exoDNAse (exonuclease V) alpha subunit
MLNNKWFYTAITRAEEKVYLIGQRYALRRACTNMEGVKRQTWLGLLGTENALDRFPPGHAY